MPRRPPAMDLQWVDSPAVTTMTRPVSGSAPPPPPPPPRLSHPILVSDTRSAYEIKSVDGFEEFQGELSRRGDSSCQIWQRSALSSTVASHREGCRHAWLPTIPWSRRLSRISTLYRTAPPQHHVHTHTNHYDSLSLSLSVISLTGRAGSLALWLHHASSRERVFFFFWGGGLTHGRAHPLIHWQPLPLI